MPSIEERNQAAQELLETIASGLEDAVVDHTISHGELTLVVEAHSIKDVLLSLRDDPKTQFRCLMDICGVDYPERVPRFEVVYHLLSMVHNQRIRVKLRTDEDQPVPSVNAVFSAAGWWERETYDLFGIFFSGHPDLRRILTDYGFEGHPLRKDFPLTGFVEMRYDEEQKRCVYEPVRMPLDWRSFDFLSTWEGPDQQRSQPVLPGDEKAQG